MGGDAGVCVADGVDPGDRLRGPEVSVSCQQRQYLLDRPGSGDPGDPKQLADQHGRSVQAQVEQGRYDSVGEIELGYASAAWRVAPLASSPVMSSSFALIGPGLGEVGSQPCQGRHRTKVTKGPGSKAAGLAMAFKLIEAAQQRWRAVNAPHLVALVRAGARFERGKLVERPAAEPVTTDEQPLPPAERATHLDTYSVTSA